MRGRDELGTHSVFNQPEATGDRDLWSEDPVLQTHARGGDGAALAAHGAVLGRADVQADAIAAERNLPQLRLFDSGGRRLDEVAYHPAYHRMMQLGLGAGYAATPWTGGSHVTHAALVYLHSQVEPGSCCPMTMTYAAVPALDADPALRDLWRPRLTAAAYDPSLRPVTAKRGATMGMAMTEKQGGSDLRSNSTRAERADGAWRLTGHKWFCSAPMSDAFLTLGQAPGGLTCFLVPRWDDAGRNAIQITRLKDKLGNRANASAEIEYHGARAHRLGEEGRGVATIIEMVHHTRLDTATAPAGLMRAALARAQHWLGGRSAFQRRLIDAPLMRQVLADLTLDAEAATALAFHVARCFDDPARRTYARLAVALAKFLNNKLCTPVIGEAMEMLGGMGYVEDTQMPVLFREAPLNGIWEGAGNVICLDILRTLQRVPAAVDALRDQLGKARGDNGAYDRALDAWDSRWHTPPDEAAARVFAAQTARLLAASVLIGAAPGPVAGAYCATRLSTPDPVAGTAEIGDPAPIIVRLGAG